MNGDQVSETVAAAFGHPVPVRVSTAGVAEQAVADAFGRTTSADEALLADLEEAGYTASGARGVLSRLADGFPADAALHGSAFMSAVQPGRVEQLVHERGAGVLRRHGRVVAEVAAPAKTGAVAEARDRLVTAYRSATPSASQQIAERYADAAVTQWLDSGIRQGWSEQQVLEGLDKQRASLAARTRTGGRR